MLGVTNIVFLLGGSVADRVWWFLQPSVPNSFSCASCIAEVDRKELHFPDSLAAKGPDKIRGLLMRSAKEKRTEKWKETHHEARVGGLQMDRESKAQGVNSICIQPYYFTNRKIGYLCVRRPSVYVKVNN